MRNILLGSMAASLRASEAAKALEVEMSASADVLEDLKTLEVVAQEFRADEQPIASYGDEELPEDEEMGWENFQEEVGTKMKALGGTKWKATGKNMGWRKQSGTAEFEAADAKTLISKITPKTSEFTIKLYEAPDHLEFRVSHHDAQGEEISVYPDKDDADVEAGLKAGAKSRYPAGCKTKKEFDEYKQLKDSIAKNSEAMEWKAVPGEVGATMFVEREKPKAVEAALKTSDFKVGDKVSSEHGGDGVVTLVSPDQISVEWSYPGQALLGPEPISTKKLYKVKKISAHKVEAAYTGDLDKDFETASVVVEIVAETVASQFVKVVDEDSDTLRNQLAVKLYEKAKGVYAGNPAWGQKLYRAEHSSRGSRDLLVEWMQHWAEGLLLREKNAASAKEPKTAEGPLYANDVMKAFTTAIKEAIPKNEERHRGTYQKYESEIWEKMEPMIAELRGKLSQADYDALEEENYHTANEWLKKHGYFVTVAAKFKSDEDIAKEFDGVKVTDKKVGEKHYNGSFFAQDVGLELEFPEGEESVGGGMEGGGSIFEPASIYFDKTGKKVDRVVIQNWYPPEVQKFVIEEVLRAAGLNKDSFVASKINADEKRKKTNALVPSERDKVCDHEGHRTRKGSMPGTGPEVCMMCGHEFETEMNGPKDDSVIDLAERDRRKGLYLSELKASAGFDKWLDNFVAEKGIDLEDTFEVEGESGTNDIPYGVVVEHMKITSPEEQKKIKDIIAKIDFNNGDVLDFFRHLGKAIAQ